MRIIELFGSDQESTKYVYLLVDLFDELFGNEMMRLSRLSVMLENSLVLFMYCLSFEILVQPIATLWWNWVKVPRLQITLGLKRRNSCALQYFGVLRLVLSRRKLSCEQFSSPFYWTTFTTHSCSVETGKWWWLGLCLPKFVSALRTSKFSTLHFAQVVKEFYDSPSSISLYM